MQRKTNRLGKLLQISGRASRAEFVVDGLGAALVGTLLVALLPTTASDIALTPLETAIGILEYLSGIRSQIVLFFETTGLLGKLSLALVACVSSAVMLMQPSLPSHPGLNR